MNRMQARASGFSPASLAIDAAAETDRIVAALHEQLRGPMRKRGLIIGLSGGIDSSVCAALAARAVGSERVFCLFMPETETGLHRLPSQEISLSSVLSDPASQFHFLLWS
jgi:NAD+ synthase